MNSCTKEGPVGPAGAQGPQGPSGSNGTNGNTNVKSSFLTVNPNNWQWNSSNYVSYVEFNNSQITSDVINYGLVLAFRKSTNAGTEIWIPMPNVYYPFSNSLISWTYDIGFISLGAGRIRFAWSDSRNSPPDATQVFKIVSVSGSAKAANPNLDWNNWNQVKQTFHLTD